jgi:hypothetical protein
MTNEVKDRLEDAIRSRIKQRPAVDMGQGSREASFRVRSKLELKIVSKRQGGASPIERA